MEFPQRKHVRLKDYDYGQAGMYFVTICTQNRRCILSQITPPCFEGAELVGRGLAPAALRLTDCGRLVENELTALTERYPSVAIEKYVIMPNHFHGLIRLRETAGGKPPPYIDAGFGHVQIFDHAPLEREERTIRKFPLAIRLSRPHHPRRK